MSCGPVSSRKLPGTFKLSDIAAPLPGPVRPSDVVLGRSSHFGSRAFYAAACPETIGGNTALCVTGPEQIACDCSVKWLVKI